MKLNFVKAVRQRFCKHKFEMVDNEFNRVSRAICYPRYQYKCTKCGKIVWLNIKRWST